MTTGAQSRLNSDGIARLRGDAGPVYLGGGYPPSGNRGPAPSESRLQIPTVNIGRGIRRGNGYDDERDRERGTLQVDAAHRGGRAPAAGDGRGHDGHRRPPGSP